MATNAELVRVFGEREVVRLDRADAEAGGLSPADVEALCEVGLPASMGFYFSMRVDEPEAFTVLPVQAEGEDVPLLVLGGSPDGEPLRFCLDMKRGYVLLLALAEGEESTAEIVNRTLDDFVEFLYRIELRGQELAGASDEEARAYTAKLAATLEARDPEAFGEERLWGGVLGALAEAGAPVLGTRKSIRRALEELLPGVEPLAWGTGAAFLTGVKELSAHPADGHWLLTTHGFSDLDGEADGVGLGYELTLRVPRGAEEQPPGWSLKLLMELGEYVFSDKRSFADGHRMDIINPIGGEGRLTALAFVEDPRLGTIETPHGPLTFLAAVGISAEELAEAKASGTHGVVASVCAPDGLPVTDIAR
ncbi:suppressor of fused domain protein [Actinomadura sp. 21ATH]|uniref:suppressor of fused domain protein n=1 Tax=Actinomadura sp. 21ATH TaxID=1735444 RepID=UPI0035C14DD1